MRPIHWKANILLVVALVLSFSACKPTAVRVNDLRCEYREDPLGIDNTAPRLSWKIVGDQNIRGQKQTAYQILVAASVQALTKGNGDLWDSGKVKSDQSVSVVYTGQALTSHQSCYWKVRVWDKDGKASDWSATGRFSMGLLNAGDWKGEWIHKEDQKKTDHNWYRKNIELKSPPQSATVHVGSFGYHELYVNGKKVTDNVMNPVASYMKKRIPYLTYDVTDFLEKGDNVIAVWHAAGWSRWRRIREYRNIPFVFKAQVEIETAETTLSFGTDTSWKCKKSNSEYYGDWDILHFGGETIDDRLKEEGWNTAAYDDDKWANAVVYNAAKLNSKIPEGDNISIYLGGGKSRTMRSEYSDIKAELSAQMVEPQVRFKEIKPITVKDNGDGTYRIDMGENYTGFFEMNLYKGKEGDSVFFEISDQTELIMNWNQKSQYIYGKSGKGHFTNRFNIGAGRWITVYGLSYKPKLEDIKGFVVTSNRRQVSSFESSSELLNQIYQINLNTYIANTMDGILVDCPHRERRGWGEVTVAAMYGDALPNYESGAYMDQYTQFMRDAQARDGGIRGVINEEDRLFLMWKANSPITVWETYRMLGDKKILTDNYASMQRWMDWLYKNSHYETGGALKTGKQGSREFPGLGDWCTPRGNFWSSANSPASIHFNNCVYAFMLENAVDIATVLGKTEDAKTYADRLKVQRQATHNMAYHAETGKYADGLQVDQAFALLAGITPEAEKQKVSANLVDNVLYEFPYYDTGSSGQALYTRYFTEGGERMDLIYELLQDTRHPSYGYFIRQGKTVWPERWSAVGNSQIHTCYTGIGGYFIKGFGGIRNGEHYGMQHFVIKPAPVGDLSYANTAYESMYGTIKVNWKREASTATYHIEVPVNTTAKVYLPAISKADVKEGDVLADKAEGATFMGTEKSAAIGQYVIYEVQSGSYDFSVNAVPEVSFPEPLYQGDNLARIARMNASSMHIVTEKLPGFEAFKANDEDLQTAWQAEGTENEWLELEWLKPQTFNAAIIQEEGNNIQHYKVQYFDGKTWQDLAQGQTCVSGKEHRFQTVRASQCRVLIEKAKAPAVIAEIKIMME